MTPTTDNAVSPVRELFAVLMDGNWSIAHRVSASSYGEDTGEEVWSEQDSTAWLGLVGKEEASIALSRRSLDTADGVDKAEELYDELLPLMQVDAPDVYGRKVKAQAVIVSALASRGHWSDDKTYEEAPGERGDAAPSASVTGKERDWMRHYKLSLNRRATVEQELFNVANGKRGALSPDECRALALKLGMSGDVEADGTKPS